MNKCSVHERGPLGVEQTFLKNGDDDDNFYCIGYVFMFKILKIFLITDRIKYGDISFYFNS